MSSTQYIELPIETDPEALARSVFEALAFAFPGWLPAPGNLETILTESFARVAAIARDTASTVPVSVFRSMGLLVGVLPLNATAATATTTWTMRDNLGYTIRAGIQIGIRTAGDVLIPFRVRGEVTVPPGSTATAAGEVVIDAVNAGAAGSGLGTVGGRVELLDPLDFVATDASGEIITLVAPTSGGVDAESDSTFLDRLSARLTLLAPRPILPRDFSLLARDLAWVDRSVTIDQYNADTSTAGQERTVAVYAIDAAGATGSALNKAALDAYLQGLREQNFVVTIGDPAYTTVDVSFTAVASAGYTPSDVEDAAVAAITSFLNPGNWGRPTSGDRHGWTNVTVVRYRELVALIENVQGIDHLVTGPEIGLNGGAQTEADHTLTGVVALPNAGVIVGGVT